MSRCAIEQEKIRIQTASRENHAGTFISNSDHRGSFFNGDQADQTNGQIPQDSYYGRLSIAPNDRIDLPNSKKKKQGGCCWKKQTSNKIKVVSDKKNHTKNLFFSLIIFTITFNKLIYYFQHFLHLLLIQQLSLLLSQTHSTSIVCHLVSICSLTNSLTEFYHTYQWSTKLTDYPTSATSQLFHSQGTQQYNYVFS